MILKCLIKTIEIKKKKLNVWYTYHELKYIGGGKGGNYVNKELCSKLRVGKGPNSELYN
jgi:hypothetical protein